MPASDCDYDLVVLGAGGAGMTAALVAAIEGQRVLLIEKSSQIGGSTARAAGTAWVPGNFGMDTDAANADVSAARQYLDNVVGDRSEPSLREQYLRQAPQVMRYLHTHTKVRFQPCPKHTDYYPEVPGARFGGRPVEAVVYNGRALGPHFKILKPPLKEFMVFGGMMVSKADIDQLLNARRSLKSFRHAASLILRYGMDKLLGYSRGTRLTMGNALCARLLRSSLDAGVTLQLNSEVRDIEPLANAVSGVRRICISVGGKDPNQVTAKAIVFAGGGFSANVAWRKRLMPSPVPTHTAANETNNASTIELALNLGARLGTPSEYNAWWFPSSVVARDDGTTGVFPHIIMDRAKPGLIAVGNDGKRFVNEGVNYHEFCLAQYRHQTVPCWLICDTNFIQRYGLGAIHPGASSLDDWIRRGYIKCAETITALANEIGVDANALVDTTERMTEYAKTGKDLEFAKGDDPLSHQNGDPGHTPNPCLGPVNAPPFYAVQVAPADLGTSLGLETNDNAQLLDASGEPIVGLYACGNDMNSIMADRYPAPGVSIGPGMTFGYIAARHAKFGASPPR